MKSFVVIFALCLSATLAFAGSDATCVVYEIAATKGASPTMDTALKPIAKNLQQPPFSAWNVFTLQSKQDVDLNMSKPKPLPLKSGKASLMLRGRGASSVQLEITVDDAKGNRILEAKPDLPTDQWLVVGAGNKDGHLLALRCK